MTLSTRVILEKYQGVDTADFKDSFSVMYTPMNTGEFDYYGKDPISILIVLIFEMLGLGASRLIQASAEKHENVIELIMKRLGVQKSVVVTRDVVVNAVYSFFFTFVACFAVWGALLKDTIGVEVLILFAILN